jgi:LacI family transcriptional regulator
VDGLLLSVTPTADERITALKKSRTPFVLINNYMKGVSSVDGRPEPGMRKAFEHAMSLGHQRVGYVTGDLGFRNATDRLEVFRRLSDEFGLHCRVVEGNFSRTSGYVCAGKLLQADTPPTLIMTAADREAMGVLDYCRQHRIRVPEDVSVIGYDNLDPARNISPGLTTVDNPVSAAGRVAAQLLIDMIEGRIRKPVTRWLDTGFVERESSGPCRERQGG